MSNKGISKTDGDEVDSETAIEIDNVDIVD